MHFSIRLTRESYFDDGITRSEEKPFSSADFSTEFIKTKTETRNSNK